MTYDLAVLLTSCPDVRFQSPKEGLHLALDLVERGGEGALAGLEVAARAQEALGDWASAEKLLLRLLNSLPLAADTELVDGLKKRLAECQRKASVK